MQKDRELQTIIYHRKEMIKEENFRDWVSQLSLNKLELSGVDAEEIQAELGELGLEKDAGASHNCLWITGKMEHIELAKNKNIAVLGYQRMGSGPFLPVEYVISEVQGIDERYLNRVFCRFHDIPWRILETKRCVVREFAMNDLDDLFGLYNKPGMTDYVEPLYAYEEEAEYERAYIKHRYRYYGYGMWLVFDKESKELIGRAGLEDREYQDGMKLELGYMIAPEYQKKGYATEVCRAIIDYAREELEYTEISCLIDERNTASVRLVERLGFSCQGQTDVTGEKMCLYTYDI